MFCFQQNHREMLEIQLVHSRSTKEGSCPVFTPAVGVEALHQYAERNQDELETLGNTCVTVLLVLIHVQDLCDYYSLGIEESPLALLSR